MKEGTTEAAATAFTEEFSARTDMSIAAPETLDNECLDCDAVRRFSLDRVIQQPSKATVRYECDACGAAADYPAEVFDR